MQIEKNGDSCEGFYEKAEQYWSRVPATVDGMLGGFGCVSFCDIQGSEAFLKKIFGSKLKPGRQAALDCGAGIGRITKNLLLKHFRRVDLVEQNATFVEEAKTFLSSDQRVGNFYCCGLQEFEPEEKTYDVIWCQWVLGHLTDEHLVKFLINCKKGLKENGLIIIKENVAHRQVDVDDKDSSITRPVELFRSCFVIAGLNIVRECKQVNFPKALYPVQMFALKPQT